MSDEKIQPIIDWIKNEGCPVKSGRTYHQLQNTKQQSFETFQQTNTYKQNPISQIPPWTTQRKSCQSEPKIHGSF